MRPYFEADGITIYCGDSREIVPRLVGVEAVITDPPYGISLDTNYASRKRGVSRIDYTPVHGDTEPFDPTHLLAFPQIVLWGANYYARSLPERSGWLVWDKRCGRMQNDQADAELAWTSTVKGVRVFHHEWNGYHRASERGEHYHPTQKPVALMQWCLSLVPDAAVVLDPYMGAGPLLRAAKNLRRRAIGIEINEAYCEIAVKRLAQEVLAL